MHSIETVKFNTSNRSLNIFYFFIASSTFFTTQSLMAQPNAQVSTFAAVNDNTSTKSYHATEQTIERSSITQPTTKEFQLKPAVEKDKAHTQKRVKQANATAAETRSDKIVTSSVRTHSTGNRNSVHFSEWLKDNPDITHRMTTGSVSEDEIRAILADALDRAISRSPSIRQTLAEQSAASADVREAEGQRWPQIDVGANSAPSRLGGGSSESTTRQAINLNVTTNVFDWGRTKNTIDSRKELSSATDKKYLANLEELAREVSSTVVELEKNRRISTISQHYVERMSTLVGMLNEIVETDRGRFSELAQARARLMEAQASFDASRAREQNYEIRLRKLIGDSPLILPENGDWALSSSNLSGLLAAAKQHPALLQAEHEANASERHAESLRAAEKPQLNWVVTKTTGEDQLGREQPWQTMVTVSWPLFRGGSSRAAREAALMRADAERERKAQQELDLEFEVRTAYQDATTLLKRADLYHELKNETDEVRKAFFEQWYHLGRRTLLDVLIAESDHNNNRINEVLNRFDGYQAILKARSSSGQLSNWLRNSRASIKQP